MRSVLVLSVCLSATSLFAAENQLPDIPPPALARSQELTSMLVKSGRSRLDCDVYDLTLSPPIISGLMIISFTPPGPLVITVRGTPLSFEYTDFNIDGVVDNIHLTGRAQTPRVPELLSREQLVQELKDRVEQNRAGIQMTFIVAVEHAIECVAGGKPNAAPASL